MEKRTVTEWLKENVSKILISVCMIVIGILLFVNPIGFTNGIIIACGVVMMLLGLVYAIKYFTTKKETALAERSLFGGLLLLVVGIFCAFTSKWFIAAFDEIPIMYGIFLLLMALNDIQETANMIRSKNKKWFLEFILALMLVVFVILIFVNPFGAGKGIWIFTGIALIVCSLYHLILLIVFAKRKKAADNTDNTVTQ